MNYTNTVFIEFYKAVNLGDDLFVKALLEKYPKQRFTIIAGKNYSKILSEYKNVSVLCSIYDRIRSLIDDNLLIKKYSYKNIIASKCMLSVLIGGSIFIEPFLPRFKNNLIKKKELYVIGASFGPFSSQKYYSYCEEYISSLDDMCFRDYNSYKLFERMKNVRCAPDILFAQYRYSDDIGEGVFVSAMDFSRRSGNLKNYQDEYEEYVISAIRFYRKKSERIVLCSFCKIEGDEWAINSIVRKLTPEEQSVCRLIMYNGMNSTEVVENIRSSRIIIGTRFHSVVLGLTMGRHVIAISYSNKTSEMLKDLGFDDKFVRIDNCKNGQINTIHISQEKQRELAEKSKSHFSVLDSALIFD